MTNLTAREYGFTLVEMMVALLLLSMIALIGYQGIVFDIKQWNAGEVKLGKGLNEFTANSMMRNKLSSAERLSYEVNGNHYVAFSGNHDEVKFISKFEKVKQGGMYTCILRKSKQDDSVELHYGLFHPENGSFSKPGSMRKTKVLQEISSIHFWYFGSINGETGRWHKQWNTRTELPLLVKYRLTRQDGRKSDSVIFIETAGT